MTNEQLIKSAAEIAGVTIKTICRHSLHGDLPKDHECHYAGNTTNWRPLHDANHMEMVEDKLIEMGFSIAIKYGHTISIQFRNDDGLLTEVTRSNNKTDWPKTKLIAYIEAIRALRETGEK